MGSGGLNANVVASYEALPPNYGLGHNMMAGAFAGIAVRADRNEGAELS